MSDDAKSRKANESSQPEKRFSIAGMADPSHPIYRTGYIIGSLANTIKPKLPRITIVSTYRPKPDR